MFLTNLIISKCPTTSDWGGRRPSFTMNLTITFPSCLQHIYQTYNNLCTDVFWSHAQRIILTSSFQLLLAFTYRSLYDVTTKLKIYYHDPSFTPLQYHIFNKTVSEHYQKFFLTWLPWLAFLSPFLPSGGIVKFSHTFCAYF